MTTTGFKTFDHSLTTTKQWLKDVEEEMQLANAEQALEVTRAVLQTLRDRLTVKGAADFAAQLPMLLQGVFYHEWTPTDKPEKIRSQEDFLLRIADRLLGKHSPDLATAAVFTVIEKRMSAGEIDDVKSILPADIRQLWPSAEPSHL